MTWAESWSDSWAFPKKTKPSLLNQPAERLIDGSPRLRQNRIGLDVVRFGNFLRVAERVGGRFAVSVDSDLRSLESAQRVPKRPSDGQLSINFTFRRIRWNISVKRFLMVRNWRTNGESGSTRIGKSFRKKPPSSS
jgi:hypothetical protein